MRSLWAVLLAFLMLAGSAFAGDSDASKDATTKPHALPDDPKAVIITLDYTGGMMRRLNKEPVLVIHADGNVRAGDPYGAGKDIDGTLTGEELQSLIHEILDVQQFAKIEAKDLKLPGNMMVTDAQTTSIAVTLPDVDKNLSAYSIETVVSNAGADSPAAHFLAVRRRIDQVVLKTLIGGDAELAKEIDAINVALKTDLPKDPPMDGGDMKWVNVSKGGTSVASFSKKVTEADGWHMTFATVTRTADGKISAEVKSGAVQHDTGK